MANAPLPSQMDLLLPLLGELKAAGGTARPGEIYDRLAAELGLDDEARNATTRIGGRDVNLFERRVRWTRQTAVLKSLVSKERRGLWQLTDSGNHALLNARRGTIVTFFTTPNGVALWGCVEDVIGVVERESLQCIISSPPYPLLKKKEYGNLEARAWVDWLLKNAEGWRDLLHPSGSLMLNLGPTWNPGAATQNTYIERFIIAMEDLLGYHLCQRLYWHSPSKLPQPIEYVAMQRIRVTPAVEPILWFSPSASPKADNRKVLRPYSAAMQRTIKNGQKKSERPSGMTISTAFANDNGGSIPHDLLTASNSSSNDSYQRGCRERGLAPHPARFPEALPAFCIALTTDEEDTVADFFGGSGTVAAVAERMNRKWIIADRSRHYLEGAAIRFPNAQLCAA